MRLLHVLAELRAHVSHAHINVCVQILRLDQTFDKLSVLRLLLTLGHLRDLSHLQVHRERSSRTHIRATFSPYVL